MVNITIKTDSIVIAVGFEAAVVKISNFLIKVRSTRVILSIKSDLEVKVKNQEQKISSLHLKYSSTVDEHPIA